MDLKKYIRSIPDYPKKGILFRDITTLIKDENAFKSCIDKILEISKKINFDKIAAILSKSIFFEISTILLMQLLNAFLSFIRVVISLNNIPFLG